MVPCNEPYPKQARYYPSKPRRLWNRSKICNPKKLVGIFLGGILNDGVAREYQTIVGHKAALPRRLELRINSDTLIMECGGQLLEAQFRIPVPHKIAPLLVGENYRSIK